MGQSMASWRRPLSHEKVLLTAPTRGCHCLWPLSCRPTAICEHVFVAFCGRDLIVCAPVDPGLIQAALERGTCTIWSLRLLELPTPGP